MFCIFAFPPQKVSSNYLVSIRDGEIVPVMNIETDQQIRTIEVAMEDNYHFISEFLPFLSSTKTGTFAVAIKYKLGFRVENYEEDENGDYFIRLS